MAAHSSTLAEKILLTEELGELHTVNGIAELDMTKHMHTHAHARAHTHTHTHTHNGQDA